MEQYHERKKKFLQSSTTCVHCNEIIPNTDAEKHWVVDIEAPEKHTCMINLARRKSLICYFCKVEMVTTDFIESFKKGEMRPHTSGVPRQFPFPSLNPRIPSSCTASQNRDFEEHLKKKKEIEMKRKQISKKLGLLNENGEYVKDKMKCHEERIIVRCNVKDC